MLAEAQANKELLVKYGLAETVLAGMDRNVKQFDLAIDQSTEARRGHVGASAELDAIGEQILHLLSVMDGLNRDRFAESPEILAEWASASNVFGPVRTNGEKSVSEQKPVSQEVTPPAGGESKAA
jgi:hypothetical protein